MKRILENVADSSRVYCGCLNLFVTVVVVFPIDILISTH